MVEETVRLEYERTMGHQWEQQRLKDYRALSNLVGSKLQEVSGLIPLERKEAVNSKMASKGVVFFSAIDVPRQTPFWDASITMKPILPPEKPAGEEPGEWFKNGIRVELGKYESDKKQPGELIRIEIMPGEELSDVNIRVIDAEGKPSPLDPGKAVSQLLKYLPDAVFVSDTEALIAHLSKYGSPEHVKRIKKVLDLSPDIFFHAVDAETSETALDEYKQAKKALEKLKSRTLLTGVIAETIVEKAQTSYELTSDPRFQLLLDVLPAGSLLPILQDVVGRLTRGESREELQDNPLVRALKKRLSFDDLFVLLPIKAFQPADLVDEFGEARELAGKTAGTKKVFDVMTGLGIGATAVGIGTLVLRPDLLAEWGTTVAVLSALATSGSMVTLGSSVGLDNRLKTARQRASQLRQLVLEEIKS